MRDFSLCHVLLRRGTQGVELQRTMNQTLKLSPERAVYSRYCSVVAAAGPRDNATAVCLFVCRHTISCVITFFCGPSV